jgi:hypothetical protein
MHIIYLSLAETVSLQIDNIMAFKCRFDNVNNNYAQLKPIRQRILNGVVSRIVWHITCSMCFYMFKQSKEL